MRKGRVYIPLWIIFFFLIFLILIIKESAFATEFPDRSLCIHHILSTGQSLSKGDRGGPGLTRMQPYNNVLLDDTVGPVFAPLVELNQESMSSAMANFITANTKNNNYRVEVSIHGAGGASYGQLEKGTAPYEKGMLQVKLSLEAAKKLDLCYLVTAVTVIHGETDDKNAVGTEYEKFLVTWERDYQSDVKAITSQTEDIPLFTDQYSSFSLERGTSELSIAQLSAAEHNPGKIILVSPKYFLDYTDGPHLKNYSYRQLGEYYGKVYKRVIIDHKSWIPLSPKSVLRKGSVITVHFFVPVPPLVLDIKRVLEQKNYGFEYVDDSSDPPNIKQVKISGTDTIQILLSAVPHGSNERLRYAYTGVVGKNPGAHEPGSARGNVRDSDNTKSLYRNDLFNWLVHFDKPIHIEKEGSDFSTTGFLQNVFHEVENFIPFIFRVF